MNWIIHFSKSQTKWRSFQKFQKVVLTFGFNPAISQVFFLEFPHKITNFFEKYLQKGSRNETFLVAKRQADPNICEQTGSPRCWSPSGSGCRCTTLKLETFPAMALAEASCILAFEWVVFSIWSSVTNSNEIAAFQGDAWKLKYLISYCS